MVFVFGANEASIHGAGAALYAVKHHGAINGKGGRQGNSYAIPTKDKDIKTLPLHAVRKYVSDFVCHAILHPEEEFQITRIGCGLAGYDDADIAPMFAAAPANCFFDEDWERWLPGQNFWGTF